jgi:hypothetical protein
MTAIGSSHFSIAHWEKGPAMLFHSQEVLAEFRRNIIRFKLTFKLSTIDSCQASFLKEIVARTATDLQKSSYFGARSWILQFSAFRLFFDDRAMSV